jgi:glycosyltransferase involved in cell wall biosynthesis
LRDQWHVSDKRPAVLYAGRLSREKGLALLDAIDSSLYRRGVQHRLIVAGDGPMADELRSRCPDAHFLGNVRHEDMGTMMASADLFLFPSDTDTAGNVVLEAQACGLPVLVSDTGGPKEQIVDRQTGYVCASKDVESFGSRAAALLTARDLRAEMAAAARAHALTRTWQAALQPLFSTYRTMLAARAAATSFRPVDTRAGLSTP